MFPEYELMHVDSVSCNVCGNSDNQWLLSPKTFCDTLPAFYVCRACGHIGQVGVGPVPEREMEEP
jgi:hypothetical protein